MVGLALNCDVLILPYKTGALPGFLVTTPLPNYHWLCLLLAFRHTLFLLNHASSPELLSISNKLCTLKKYLP